MTDIYADGIGNVRLAGTNARIDLLVVGDQPDQEGNPTMQKKAELRDCETVEEFEAIAVKYGYKKGWGYYQWQLRNKKR